MTRNEYRKMVERQAWICMTVALCMATLSAAFIASLLWHAVSGR